MWYDIITHLNIYITDIYKYYNIYKYYKYKLIKKKTIFT